MALVRSASRQRKRALVSARGGCALVGLPSTAPSKSSWLRRRKSSTRYDASAPKLENKDRSPPLCEEADRAVMAILGAMPWPELHFEAMSRESALESPRPSTRERRSSREGADSGQGLVAISPLLGAAPAPGALPALVPVDEAAAHWSNYSCLMEDVVDLEPLALSPDAATRHLPKSLIDIDDLEVQGIKDETDYALTSGKHSSALHEELHHQFMEVGDHSWDLASNLRDSCDEWGLFPFSASWNGNTEESWALEVALQNACWDPDTDVAAMFWDTLSWEQASIWNESREKSSWVEAEATRDAWDDQPGEVTQEGSKAAAASEDVFETPEKPEKQKRSKRNKIQEVHNFQEGIDEDEAVLEAPEEEDDKLKKVTKVVDRQTVELKGSETTVMLRNIPNKYTRDMLAKQLSRDHKGCFDFIYLPIDFKNKCNVGYAFVNLRSTELCQEFIESYNGVAVRKCLPGFNSKKVVEVTLARVQGLEENVSRLRNSPVMAQLKDKPEWMPLLFDEAGKPDSFPEPDVPLPPVRQWCRTTSGHGRMKDVQK